MGKKKPSFIETHASDIKRQQDAVLLEKVMACLTNKGFVFESDHDVHSFFKNRLRNVVTDDGTNTLTLDDGTPICAYRNPTAKPLRKREKDKQDINISFEFIEL